MCFLFAERLLRRFERYLRRYGRANTKPAQASEHVSRARLMLSVLDDKITVDSLQGDDFLKLGPWLRDLKRAPGTKQTYLNTWLHLVNFVEDRNLGAISDRQLRRLRLEREGWLKSLRKSVYARKRVLLEKERGKYWI